MEALVNCLGICIFLGLRSHRDTELCKRLFFVNIYCIITFRGKCFAGGDLCRSVYGRNKAMKCTVGFRVE